jgi:hypothetical protein
MTTQLQTVYCITVEGQLDAAWAEWFDKMSVTAEQTDDGIPTTTLTGPVADQSALRGILNKLWDLNLTVVSVRLLHDARQHPLRQFDDQTDRRNRT